MRYNCNNILIVLKISTFNTNKDNNFNIILFHFQRLESVTCADSIDNAVYESSLIIGGTLALLYMVIGSIITIVGGKNLLLLFFTVTSACGIAAQLTQGSLLIKILMGVFLMASSCVGIINTVVVELYPTHLRGMALAISLMAGRFGAVTGSYITGQLIYKLCDFTFYIFGLDHLSKYKK